MARTQQRYIFSLPWFRRVLLKFKLVRCYQTTLVVEYEEPCRGGALINSPNIRVWHRSTRKDEKMRHKRITRKERTRSRGISSPGNDPSKANPVPKHNLSAQFYLAIKKGSMRPCPAKSSQMVHLYAKPPFFFFFPQSI